MRAGFYYTPSLVQHFSIVLLAISFFIPNTDFASKVDDNTPYLADKNTVYEIVKLEREFNTLLFWISTFALQGRESIKSPKNLIVNSV